MADFVHLHVHSDFSLQDAAVSVMALADRAGELGMKYLALTDHGNMFGAMEFLAACKETLDARGNHEERKTPIYPIIGCEVYVANHSRFEKKYEKGEDQYWHMVLLAASREGYFNLIKLCSLAYVEGFYFKPRIDDELLKKYRRGLIVLSACLSGEIPSLIQAGKTKEAEEKARYYRDLFGDDEQGQPNFYLEIQSHDIPADALKGTDLSERQVYQGVIDIARRTGIPLVATNDVHYLNREDSEAHDAFICIGPGKQRSEVNRKRYYGDTFYFRSPEEMAALFPEYPEAITNTVRIAKRCVADFLLTVKDKEGNERVEYKFPHVESNDLPKYLPEFEIPKAFADADAYLTHLTGEGLEKRYSADKTSAEKGSAGAWEEARKRAKYELDVIIQMGFTGYFLIVADFTSWAREHNIPVGPGRGSGAGSIVAYALGITNMDPLKYNLLFERFLNPERISMPDFDVDFANEGRKDVIDYVTQKYGRENVGQIITFGTLGAKQVIKDVARVLGIPLAESNTIVNLIPGGPGITLKSAFEDEPKLKALEEEAQYTELFTLARKLEGLNRHSSLHASGVVIGNAPIDSFVPLYRDSKTGGVATQYTMDYLEQCGLVKMDFLGIKTLDVIKHTEELIRLRGGEYAVFSIEEIPEDDADVFKMLGEGKSFEIFQFESEGMQNVLKQAKPSSIEDLIALNALYRPGPMANIPQFIESKWGRRKITYPDPCLEEILKGTYGVIVYQEQVMQIARRIAGYTMGQADILRKAMGKKKKELIEKEKKSFLEGAVKQGFSEEHAGSIYDEMAPFAGYGFNKSHAAAYAIVAYKTAYLKAHFPAEFMAATLSNEINSADKGKLSACIDESRKMGLEIDPPDINYSDKLFAVVDGRVVYGFLGIKGLGENSADEIIARRKDGPYKDFIDFLNRVDIKAVGKSVIELLIQVGAFDRFGIGRETLLGNLERAVEYAQNIKDDKKFGQASLFGDSGEKDYGDFQFQDFPDISRADRLQLEKKLIGFYFSGHPLDEYKEIWKKIVKVDLGKPEDINTGSCILVGIIKSLKPIITKAKGEKMAFATLEDYNGEIDVIFFHEPWEHAQGKIEVDKAAIIKGKIEYQDNRGGASFLAEDCLSQAQAQAAAEEEEAKAKKWDKYRPIWNFSRGLEKETGLRILDLTKAAKMEKGNYTIVGALKSLHEKEDKNGKKIAFGTLQNHQGEIDLLFFAAAWKNCKALAALDEIVALNGSIDPENDRERNKKTSFMISSFQDVNKLVRAAAKIAAANPAANEETKPELPEEHVSYRELHVRLKAGAGSDEESLFPLLDYTRENPGAFPLLIHVPVPEGEVLIKAEHGIAALGNDSINALSRCAPVAQAWGI
jgi:DNA polymerase-3 subunit alpha